MFGGGVDSNVPDHLDTDVLSIPAYDKSTFISKLQPILTARVVLVLEKDTLFNQIIHSDLIQAHKS
jgi:hypothetical protein